MYIIRLRSLETNSARSLTPAALASFMMCVSITVPTPREMTRQDINNSLIVQHSGPSSTKAQADLTVRAKDIIQPGNQQLMVWGMPQGIELFIRIGIAGRIQLMGTDGQLLGTYKVQIIHLRYRKLHLEVRQKLLAWSR